jgi:hypothetical protein
MASNVTGDLGGQPIELNNAATESTLAALLAVAKNDSMILRKMAEKAGVDAKAIEKASKALEAQGKAAGNAGGGVADLGMKANLVGGFMADMAASVSKTMGNLINFGDELMEGKARASDLFKAFKDLPLGLGLLAQMFEKVMKYQERNLDIYQKISSTGVGLNGSLASLRTTASSMGLTLDEYANVVKNNADVMTKLGINAGSGSRAFSKINEQLTNQNTGLLELGYTYEQVNNLLGGYLRQSGDAVRIGKDQNAEQTRLAAAAARYGKELDFLSRLTGESREAIEAKMQAESNEASWQMQLAQMAPEQRQKAMEALARAEAVGGKGAMDALKASIMGFAAPFSEEGRMYVATMRGGTQAIEGMAKAVKDGRTAAQAQGDLDKLQAKAMASNLKDIKALGPTIAAMGQGGTESSKALMELTSRAAEFEKKGMKSEADMLKGIIDARNRQDADKNAAAAAVANERSMKQLSNQINLALMPVMELLAKHGNAVVQSFVKFITEVDMAAFGKKLADLMNQIANYTKNIFSESGQQKIVNDISYAFQRMIIAIRKKLDPTFDDVDALNAIEQLDKDKAIYDRRAQADNKIQELENKYNAAKSMKEGKKLEDLEKQYKEEGDRLAKLKDKKDKTAKDEDDIATIEKNRAGELKLIKGMQALKLENLDPTKVIAEYEAAAKKLEQARNEKTSDDKDAEIAKWQKENPWTAALMDPFMLKKAIESTFGGREKTSLGETGNIIENFGSGTPMVLHGEEGVVNKKQLENIAKGGENAGAARAQEMLASAFTTLNKQQAMTNQILGQIADYQRRFLDTQGRFGNQFTRV